MSTNPKISGGLRPLRPDNRDFSVGAVFAPIAVSEIPDFVIGELILKNQGNTDFCSAYAVTSASELQEGVELNPLWQFAQIKKLSGDWKTWGADLRQACASAVKVGSVEQHIRFYGSSEDEPLPSLNDTRDLVANWENWPQKELEAKAEAHKKQSYFSISKGGYKDLFDAILGELWRNKEDERAVIAGVLWRPEWTNAEGGVVPMEYGEDGFGHAFLFKGKKTINGYPHLVAHLSNGEVGDKGVFYFSREIMNKEFGEYGLFLFNDFSADYYKRNYWSFWQKLVNFVRTLF